LIGAGAERVDDVQGGSSMAETVRTVETIEDAAESLDYFNGFHDGFIKTLIIVSRDEFKGRGAQMCAGELSIELILAHYNYQEDTRPHDQLIEASFNGVKDVSADFSGNSYEWSISNVSINEARRQSENGAIEECLQLIVVQNRLDSAREWRLHDDLSFTFKTCTFREIPPI
jgi:hypothetical protein